MIALPVLVAKVVVGKLPMDTHFDLGSQLDPSEDANSPADLTDPLAHSLETPTLILPVFQLPRINAATVVTHGNAHYGGSIFDLRLNLLRSGMAVRIDNRLTSNAVEFVMQFCVQFPLPAFDNHSKSHR